MISSARNSSARIGNEGLSSIILRAAPLRSVVLLAFILITLVVVELVFIEPEKQKRLQQQVSFNNLQALLNMPRAESPQARKMELPELVNELKLAKFSNDNGTQQYVITGSFFDLYRWLQQLNDSQWFPQQANWQWQGDIIELSLSLAAGAHKITNIPNAQASPFPKPQQPKPEPLQSCLNLWPAHLKLAATLGVRLVLDDGMRQWQYQQGDIHSGTGLMFSRVNNGEVILSFAQASEQSEISEGTEVSPKNIVTECLPAALQVNESGAHKPRWLP
ncbi:hypothetical protein A28LD_2263 [Idiomarina sp. A28L]|uniref:hypothetical protein n=1 Tax=Idiomarina sp. A28L TaxID=1036674 RepID=UPI0002138D89|nr:hypothetical protein [Idiomarina sp. A28L]EGN74236.1 hypothetical protein A28LD_2263 [Idiomarina sp. A28L]